MRTGLVEDSIATTNQGGSVTYFGDSSYLSFLADSGAFVMKVSLFVFLLPFSVVWSITQEFDSCNISSNLIGAVLPFMENLKRK